MSYEDTCNVTLSFLHVTLSFNLTIHSSVSDPLSAFFYSTVHTERSKLYRRTIVPLQDWERDNHLFRIPDDVSKFGPYEGIEPSSKPGLPPVENPNIGVSSVIAQSLQPTMQTLTGSPTALQTSLNSGIAQSFNNKEAMVS